MGEQGFQITLPYACFGITVQNGTVTESAPIGKWFIGRRWVEVQAWIEHKGGSYYEMSGDNQSRDNEVP